MNFDALQTIAAARQNLAALFRRNGIDQPDLDARILVCAAAEIGHAALICSPDAALAARAAVKLNGFAQRRLLGEPVSRIIGYREFWGERFELTCDVLDPRPDTETLVEAALGFTAGEPLRAWRILDLGTGSGAILGAVLRNLPQAWGLGVDVSFAACKVARRNLISLELSNRFGVICGEWTKAISGRFDIILSNPPYIERGEIGILAREVKDFDPIGALDGGQDGLTAYRQLAPVLGAHLASGGVIFLEAGIDQCEAIRELFCAAGLHENGRKLDLSGHERIISFV